MKKIIAILLVLSLVACGHPKTLTTADGVTKKYPTYGLFNRDTRESPDVCYEISVGNVVWSIILIETIVMPVYFIGFSIYNPVSVKNSEGNCHP